MIIDIVTIFPDMFSNIINDSIIKRAVDKGIVTINIHNFRDYALDKHNHVDDTTYGGGAGMLISVQPVVDCMKSIEGYNNAHKILTSPCGVKLDQDKANQLSKYDHILIVCGHYEGIDERIVNFVDEEISIGDYILTGGEIPALAILDSVIRLLPNAISDESTSIESFNNYLLEYPQYTKPLEYDGLAVPQVLVNGNHEEIRKYRLFESIKKTYFKRPDLLEKATLDKEGLLYLECIKQGLNFDQSNDYIKKLKKKSK